MKTAIDKAASLVINEYQNWAGLFKKKKLKTNNYFSKRIFVISNGFNNNDR